MLIFHRLLTITLFFTLAIALPAAARERPSHASKHKNAQAPVPDVTVGVPPAGAKNIFPWGGFDQPDESGDSPKGWQAIDGLVWQWVREQDGKHASKTNDPDSTKHGHQPARRNYLRINTDINQNQAYAWWIKHYVQGEPLSNAPARTATRPPKYNTIAGLDGGFYWSKFFPIDPGKAYKVYIDAKGPVSKVFLRGYVKKLPVSFADESPAVQELFREARDEPELDANGRPVRYRLRYLYTTWFAVGGSDHWQTYTHIKPRHPTSREITRDVRYLRVMIYAYWPPGVYEYDNVRVVEVPPDAQQAKPAADKADLDDGKVIR